MSLYARIRKTALPTYPHRAHNYRQWRMWLSILIKVAQFSTKTKSTHVYLGLTSVVARFWGALVQKLGGGPLD